jgi:tight adherence protein C
MDHLLVYGFTGCLLSFGLYQLLGGVFHVPTRREVKTIVAVGKRKREKKKRFEALFFKGAHVISKYITINPYKRKKLEAIFRSLGMTTTPEVLYATALIKGAMCLVIAAIMAIFLPIISLALVVLAILIFFKEIQRPASIMLERREEIDRELPRFVGVIEQELKSRRDVLGILSDYRKNAGLALGEELDITVADMKSSNYENALTRLESRVGSSGLSNITRGLIAVLRGDDGKLYFEMLNHEMRKLEINQLKMEVLKRPAKIKKYTILLLIAFIATFFVVLGYQIVTTLPTLF